jgi:hypothetical protein
VAGIRERLRALIDAGALPRSQPTRVRGGLCYEAHPCIACGDTITAMRDVEVEASTPAGVIFFHGRCWGIWAREGTRGTT